MSRIHQLLTLVIIAWLGYLCVSIAFTPAYLEARRQRARAGGFLIALAFANYWILIYLTVLLVGYFAHWYPWRTNLILGAAVAIGSWAEFVWWIRYRRRVTRKDDK